jgi:hypothetical protein
MFKYLILLNKLGFLSVANPNDTGIYSVSY